MVDPPQVKICGVVRREDALEADRLGAHYVGFIVSAGFGRSVAPPALASLGEGLAAIRVAVVVNEPVSRVVERATLLGAGVIQLHGDESPEDAAGLRSLGSWNVWKAVRAARAEDVERAVARYADAVDGLLVEGFREGVVGGGGAAVDPGLAFDVRRSVASPLSLVLAGGLTPMNVAEAVARFRPEVVDVSSGVEIVRGRKDPDLLRRFIERARRPPGEPPNRGEPPERGT